MTAFTAEAMSTLDSQAAALLADLASLQATSVTASTLDEWLRTYSTIKGECQTFWITHYAATKRDTTDEQGQAAYHRLMSHWMPQIEAFDAPLAQKALDADEGDLNPNIALKLKADLTGQASERLRELLAEERLLSTQYDVITAGRRVYLGGEELLMQQARTRLGVATTSSEREAIWKAMEQATLAATPELDALFLDLLRIRREIAAEAGKANYAEYIWDHSVRAFTMAEAVQMLDDIAEVFADLTTQVDRDRAVQLGIDELRPWDVEAKVVPAADATLPVKDYISLAERVMDGIDPEFGNVVRHLRAENRFDLEPRPGKSGTNMVLHSMATSSSEIVCSLAGGALAFGTVLHELGHTIHFHYLDSNPKTTYWDRDGFMEILEFFASVFTDLGRFEQLSAFSLSKSDQRWYKWSLAENILAILRLVDQDFRIESWVYQKPSKLSTEDLDTHYLELYNRSSVNWTGHKDTLKKKWQNQFIFMYSFYNIEYAMADIAALLFSKSYQDDPVGAAKRLKKAMQVGATSGSKAVLAEVDIQFPFSRKQIIEARDVLANWLA
ncbi:M3 family metallopeptidase [Deinococcus sp.]|uniref:M3 family metallopeptidase n=1 Tax=Deinococcus sp. TaxID=47478 RepID=UPI0025F91E21|nr:M3 family metallopeptidase [Deinococcus sp.]